MLVRGQFFAILRLVLHVRAGAELDRNLVFKQGSCFFFDPCLSRMLHFVGSKVRDDTSHAIELVTSTHSKVVGAAMHSANWIWVVRHDSGAPLFPCASAKIIAAVSLTPLLISSIFQ